MLTDFVFFIACNGWFWFIDNSHPQIYKRPDPFKCDNAGRGKKNQAIREYGSPDMDFQKLSNNKGQLLSLSFEPSPL